MPIYNIMSSGNAYLSYSARPTFGSTQQLVYSSDLTVSNKKNVLVNCQSIPAYVIQNGDLNVNLITTLDLTNVNVLEETNNTGSSTNTTNANTTTKIDPTKDFYLNYTIDPNGQLFGKTICGINNYQNYLVYTRPTIFFRY